MLLHFRWTPTAARIAAVGGAGTCQIRRCERQDFAIESMTDSSSVTACLHLAASGVLARSASSARSIALSTVCQSAAARGFNAASASSHCASRALLLVLA